MRWFLAAVLIGGVAEAASLDLRVLDEHGKPVAARVKVRDAKGALVVIDSGLTLVNPRHKALGVVIDGAAKIALPESALTVFVERGMEYRPELFPAAFTERTVRLRRWIDLASRGWWSGDTHVHREPKDVALLMSAADVHYAPVITRWNLNRNVDSWPEAQYQTAGPDRAYSIDNSEDERPWGAALFFGLKTPMDLWDGRSEYPLPLASWREARRRGAFIDQEKVIWWAAPAMAALVTPDSIGVANNHFLEDGMMVTEAWGRPRDAVRYPGQRGFTAYIFDLYATYLSAGFRLPASAGSANGVLANPVGYSRSYVYLGKTFTPEAWLAGQKAGRNFVTNGPALFSTVNGRMPGETLRPGAARVKVLVESSGTLEKAEVVVDGKIAASFTPGKSPSKIEGETRVTVADGGWLTVRCFEKNDATVRFAHTSPFWFGPKARRDPEALRFLRDWIDLYQALSSVKLTGTERDEWLAMLRTAKERYQ